MIVVFTNREMCMIVVVITISLRVDFSHILLGKLKQPLDRIQLAWFRSKTCTSSTLIHLALPFIPSQYT